MINTKNEILKENLLKFINSPISPGLEIVLDEYITQLNNIGDYEYTHKKSILIAPIILFKILEHIGINHEFTATDILITLNEFCFQAVGVALQMMEYTDPKSANKALSDIIKSFSETLNLLKRD